MRKTLGYTLLLAMIGLTLAVAQQKTPPTKVVIKAKNGNVTFDHTAHAKLEKNDCKVCHPAIFQQDTKAPIGFKAPHKTEETAKTSCGFCHRAGGTAFETKGNCANSKCHVRAEAKK